MDINQRPTPVNASNTRHYQVMKAAMQTPESTDGSGKNTRWCVQVHFAANHNRRGCLFSTGDSSLCFTENLNLDLLIDQ